MTSQPLPLLYLVNREALSSVFSSQVLTPLEEHRDVAKVTLGLLTPIGHFLRKQYRPLLGPVKSRCQSSGIQIGWIPSPPSRAPWLWSNSFLLRQWASKRFSRDQSFIVRCRNAEMTYIALEALKEFSGARIIYDCRGGEVIETIQQLGIEHLPESQWPPAARHAVELARLRENASVQNAAGVTCVSHAMAHMLQDRYPDASVDKFRVVPCCPDIDSFRSAIPARDIVRAELGLHHRFVVTYLGSLVWYQQPEASLSLFRKIQSIRPEAHFLALTTDPVKMRQLTNQAGISGESITIRSVSAREVPRLLVASDLGLMLRDDSETNRIASPVKLGEYLAAGVPVVISPNLGDYSEAVREHNLGVVVDLEENEVQLNAHLRSVLLASEDESRSMRERCVRYAETELSWKNVIPRLAAWYRELLDQPRPTSMDEHQPPHEVSP